MVKHPLMQLTISFVIDILQGVSQILNICEEKAKYEESDEMICSHIQLFYLLQCEFTECQQRY